MRFLRRLGLNSCYSPLQEESVCLKECFMMTQRFLLIVLDVVVGNVGGGRETRDY